MVGQEGFDEGAGVGGLETMADAGGGLLVGELDEVGGALVVVGVVAGEVFFGGPVGGDGPDEAGAPGVVAHDDDGGVVPLGLLFQDLADVGEVFIGEGEVVEVGGLVVWEGVGAAVVEAEGVGDGHVEVEEGGAGIGQGGVTGGEEGLVVGAVAVDVAEGLVLILRGSAEVEVLKDVAAQGLEGGDDVGGGGAAGGDAAGDVVAVDPEAMVEDGGEDAAVGLVPAYGGGGVVGGEGVGEDGVGGVEAGPLGGFVVLEAEVEAV